MNLAHEFGLRVVAEGVESAPERDLLASMGCDEAQGFFFSVPLAAEDLTRWLTPSAAASRP